MTTFGKLLKADRETLGWSQDQLGKELGVSQQTIGQWESDAAHPRRHRMDTLMKLINNHLPGRSQLYASWTGACTVPAVFSPVQDTTPMSRAQLHERLRAALPENLHKYVARALQLGHQERTYDYVSPAVTARALPTVDGRTPLLGTAVLTVHLAMAATRHIHEPGPTHTVALFILTPDLPAIAIRRMGAAALDAQTLGVEVVPVPDIDTKGRTITQLEHQYTEDLHNKASQKNQGGHEFWQKAIDSPPSEA